MTVSTHVYSARVLPADVELGIVGGSLTLDASGIPHVTGDLTFAVSDAALLDPRDSARVQVTAARDGGTPRVFDLGIREVKPDRAAGTVAVQLASDEAVLGDVAPLADDAGPRAHEASVRAVCDYVLAGIGAHLEPGVLDADVTAFWEVTNLVTNPSMETNAAGWTAGTNALGPSRQPVTFDPPSGYGLQWGTAAAGVSYVDYAVASGIRVTPGRWYVLSGYMICAAASTGHARVHFKNAAGVTIKQIIGASVVVNGAGWSRPFLIAQAPVAATTASVHFGFQATAGGQNPYVDAVQFYEGRELIPYYDGSTADTPAYEYTWSDAVHASASTRTPAVERPPEALIWSAGIGGMEFLAGLLKQAGLRLVCDEARRWTLRNDTYRADGGQTWRYGVNITAADEQLSLDEYYGAAVYEYTWEDRDGIPQRRLDAFQLVGPPAPVLHVQVNAPYPGPGRAENLVRRAQGRGRMVTVTGIPDWTEATDQPLSILLDGTPIQTGIAGKIVYSLDDDTVTVTSRTTDTPAAAWILIPDGERWIDSPSGESWTEENINA